MLSSPIKTQLFATGACCVHGLQPALDHHYSSFPWRYIFFVYRDLSLRRVFSVVRIPIVERIHQQLVCRKDLMVGGPEATASRQALLIER
jgi:hypothetical protein